MTERVVVVGNGMAATRLVEELISRGAGHSITVVGDEPFAPYNRILLSAVLEGSHDVSALTLREPAWYADHDVDLRLGTRVLDLDRDRREVTLVDGSTLGYDRLVLATGSNPTLPPIRGIVRTDGRLHEKVHSFRSLQDCIGLLQALPTAQRAVVVGGGLLGLQVARALAVRGLQTDIVEGSDHVLSRQVGTSAGQVLRRDLSRLGTEVYTGSRAVRLGDDGLRLDNGFVLSADLVVITAGGRPATALARRAGLTVRRGVVVGRRLESPSDDRVHAIGDCAEYDGRVPGLVSPAWEQASALAAQLSGVHTAYDGGRSVARLRATGLDVAVLGDPERAQGQVVEVTNPVAGSHRKLVVRDGVIVAGALVGDLSRVGLITQHYDRGTVLSDSEPGQLLMPDRAHCSTPLPDEAEVCLCAGVSAARVRACSSLEEVRADTRATTGCGGCTDAVRRLLGTAVTDPTPKVLDVART